MKGTLIGIKSYHKFTLMGYYVYNISKDFVSICIMNLKIMQYIEGLPQLKHNMMQAILVQTTYNLYFLRLRPTRPSSMLRSSDSGLFDRGPLLHKLANVSAVGFVRTYVLWSLTCDICVGESSISTCLLYTSRCV